MIEVLVAIVVLSIGLLGLAGLQANGIKLTQGSTFRWKASEVAADLADVMRANSADFAGTSFTVTVGQGLNGAGLTPAAQTALQNWTDNRLATLPPDSTVSVGPPPAALLVGGKNVVMAQIQIVWSDARAKSAFRKAGNASDDVGDGRSNFTMVTTL